MRTNNFNKNIFVCAIFVLCLFTTLAQSSKQGSSINASTGGQDILKEALKKSQNSISFIENLGQWPTAVKYYGSSASGQLIVKNNEIKFCTVKPEIEETDEDESSLKREVQNWGIIFENSNPNCQVLTSAVLPTSYNYFIGNDKTTHASGVKSFGEITMKDLYPGIDLRLYSQGESELEFDWIVKPGADFSLIKMSFKGQDKLSLDQKGKLIVKLNFDDLKFGIPESYQVINGNKKPVLFNFNIAADQKTVSFRTKDFIDNRYALVIDPDLKWGTFFDNNSSTFDDYAYAIDIDSSGNVFVGGVANQAISTTYLAYSLYGYDSITNGVQDGILYKIKEDGTQILAVTYFGSTLRDQLFGISLSPSQTNVFICGLTQGTIPLSVSPAAFDNAKGGTTDGYVACFNASDLGSLLYSSFIGSSGGTATGNNGSVPDDGVLSIRALSDNSYIIGATTAAALSTASPNYISGAADASYGGAVDMYIAKFTSFNTLSYGTYVGGGGDDFLNDLKVFSDGAVAFVGITLSTNASLTLTASAAGSNPGTNNEDGVVGVLAAAGSSFTQLSRIGGTAADDFNGCFIGTADTIYITGTTSSSGFPLGAGTRFQTVFGGRQDILLGKVPKLGKTGLDPWKATFIGGSGTDIGACIAGFQGTSVMIYGSTTSATGSFPVKNLAGGGSFYDSTQNGNIDIFFTSLLNDLTTLNFSTYAGGSANDYLGATGNPRGSNHMFVEGDSLIVLATTTHSVYTQPRLIGPYAGPIIAFDTTKSNGTNDTHIIFKWRIGNLLNYDHGDAPLSYAQPHHIIDTRVKIGSLLDNENLPPASPGIYARADDTSEIDDEDGLPGSSVQFFDTTTIFQKTINIVNAKSAVDTAVLIGWIDFNGNGVFDDSEQAKATALPYTSSVTLTWSGISWTAATDTSYMRLRISTDPAFKEASPSPTVNINSDGEIEDYLIYRTATCLSPSGIITGPTPVCTNALSGPYAVGSLLNCSGCTYSWSSIGGTASTPTASTTDFTWGASGTRVIQLVLSNSLGCSTTLTKNITVNAQPLADAGLDQNITNCPNDSVRIGATPTASGGLSPYSYSWSPSTGVTPSTLIANPYVKEISSTTNYAVTVTDANGCTATDQVRITVVASSLAVSISPSGSTTWCAGSGGSAVLTANVTGGASPFSYLWTGTSISPTTSSVATVNPSLAGTYTYTILVTDAKGCTSSSTIVVTVNPTPDNTFNVTGGGSYCSGGAGLSVGLDGSQTGVNYQLILNGITNIGSPIAGTGSALTFGLQTTAGSYTVRGTNSFGCSSLMTGSSIITINSSPTANAGPDASLVNCGADSVRLGASPTATGGASPYTYSWSPSSGLTPSITIANPYVRGISSTTDYTVTVTDNLGCTATDEVQITVSSSSLSVSIGAGGTTTWCAGTGVSVSLTANITGGTAPFSYLWTGTSISPTTSASATANPNIAGTYTYNVNITDANGCTSNASVTITVNASPTAYSVTGGGAYCSTGVGVSVGLSNSESGVSYQLILNGVSNIGLPIIGTGAAISFGNQSTAGTYTVIATNSFGCTLLMTGSAIVTIITAPTADAGLDQVLVACASDSVRIGGSPTASGGTAPYTYAWSPSIGVTPSTSIANPYVKGIGSTTSYFVTVTDNVGCTASDEMSILILPTTMAVSITPTGSTTWCEGSGGSVVFTANVSGGVAPYTYTWSGTSVSPTTGQVVTANPSVAGTYTYVVSVLDAADCRVSSTITVIVNPLPNTTFVVTGGGTYCSGGVGLPIGTNSSEIGVNYQLILDGVTNIGSPVAGTGGALAFGNQLSAGTYTVNAVNSFTGCSGSLSGSVVIIIASNPIADAGPDKTLFDCAADSTQLGASPTASGGLSPYTYNWSPSTGLTPSNSSSNPFVKGIVSSTSYFVTVTDANSCTATDQVTVTVIPSNLSVSISPSGPLTWCAGTGGSVVLTANITGGTAPFNYTWTGSFISPTNTAVTTANPNVAGTYTYNLSVTDRNGCLSTSSVTVTVYALPNNSFVVTGGGGYCAGGIGVSVGLNSSEIGVDYQLILGGLTNIGSPIPGTGSPLDFGNQTTGVYTVRATNALSCTILMTGFATVSMNTLPVANAGLDKSIINCPNDSIFIGGSPTASGGSSPYTYSWGPSSGLFPSNTVANPNVRGITSTTNYTVTVTDANGCTASDIATVTVIPSTLNVDIVPIGSTTWCGFSGSSVLLQSQITGGSAPYTYSWIGTDVFPATAANATANPQIPGVYNYLLIVIDASGCRDSATISVTVNSLPSAFSVTGGGSYCAGGIGVPVGINNSDTGVSYQLVFNGSLNIGLPILGTGSALSFGNQLVAGNYSVNAISSLGCLNPMTGFVTVIQNASPLANAGPDQIIITCPNDSLLLGGSPTATSGNSPYTYSWSPSLGLSSASVANPTLSGIGFSTYYAVVVTDANGCTATDQALISVQASSLVVNVVPSGGTSWCTGTAGSVVLTAGITGGTAPFNYSWIGSNLSSLSASSTIANPNVPGNYLYTVTVTDAKGCSNTANITLTVNALPDTSFAITGGGAYCAGGIGQSIGITNSELGVNYQLVLNGGTNIGFPVSGTGAAISFGNQVLAGSYTVAATNSNGCNARLSGSVTIIINSLPTADAGSDQTLVSCDSDSVRLGGSPTASGGVGPYSYLWTPITGMRPSSTIANPFVGNIGSNTTYTLYVTDANGCSDSDMVFVDVVSSTLSVAISSSGSSFWCEAEGDSIEYTAIITGGTPSFTYTWTGSSVAPINTQVVNASPQSAGTYVYDVIVTDANGCQVSAERSIIVYPLPDTTNVVLGGGSYCSGGIGVPVSLNNSQSGISYQLVLNGGINMGSPILSVGGALSFGNQTSAGTYTVIGTSAFGCSSQMSGSAVVVMNPTPSADAGLDKNLVDCPSDSVMIGGSPVGVGGLAPYTYLWSPSTGIRPSDTLSNPYVGNLFLSTLYEVTVTDVNGCTASDQMLITVSASDLGVSISPSGATRWCAFTGGSVFLTANVTAGTGPFTYQWTPASHISSTSSQVVTVNPDSTGTYTYVVVVTDAHGCQSTSSIVITVDPQPNIYATSGGGSYCAGGAGFPILLSNSQTGISYQLVYNSGTNIGAPIAGTGFPISFPNQTIAGTYTIVATSANGCVVDMSGSVVIIAYSNPTADAGVDQSIVTCPSDSVRLGGSPTATGGSGVYSYLWSPDLGLTPINDIANPYVKGISSTTTYTLVVTDSNGCTATDQIIITTVPSNIAVSISASGSTSWCHLSGGSVVFSANITGGTGPYTYTWTGTSITPTSGASATANPQIAGSYSYTLQVTDSKGCSASANIDIIVYPKPDTIYNVLGSGSYCAGGTGLPISLDSSQLGVSYQLVFNGGTLIGSPVIGTGSSISFGTHSNSGTYTVVGTTINGCSAQMRGAAIIIVNPRPVADAGSDVTMVSCSADSMRLGGFPTASGGTAPYTYAWSPITGLRPSSVEANPYAGNIGSTTVYNLLVTDSNGCSASDNVVVFIVPSTLNVVISSGGSRSWCAGTNDSVSLVANITGGAAPFSYQWFGYRISPTTTQVTSVSPDTAGTYVYTVVVTDANGCQTSDTILVTVRPTITISMNSNDTICSGSSITLGGSPTVIGGSGSFTYTWSPGTDLSSVSVANPIASPITSTIYSVSVSDLFGCSSSSSVSVVVNALPRADAGADYVLTSCSSDSVRLGGSPSASGGVGPYTYNWTPITGVRPSVSIENPYVGNIGSTTTYTLQVTDSKGCSATDQVLVTIVPSTLNVNIIPTGVSWCEGSGGSTTLTAMVTGGRAPFSFLWIGSDLTGETSQIATVNPNIAGTYPYTIIVTDAGGCQSSKTDTLSVRANTKASITSMDTIHCTTDPPYSLTAIPSGGTFSGIGVIANVFYPSISGAGTRVINYRYTNSFGCSSDTTITFNVFNIATSSISGAPTFICINGSPTSLTGSPSGGTFSGSGMVGNVFNPLLAGVGTHVITYTASGSGGCATSSTVNITVNPTPVLDLRASSDTVCPGGSVLLSPNPSFDVFNIIWSNVGGAFIRNDINPITVSPTLVNHGYYATAISSPYNCIIRDTVYIHVNQRPAAVDDTISTCEDSLMSNFSILVNDNDLEGNGMVIGIIGGPYHGTVTNHGDGTIDYLPATDYNGTDSIIYTNTDTNCPLSIDTGVVRIIICSLTDPPQVPNDTVVIPEDSTFTICYPITDPDTGDNHISTLCGVLHGSVLLTNNDITNEVCVTYVPTLDYYGKDTVCIITCDNGSPVLCDTSYIYITIVPTNDPPSVPNDTVVLPEDSTFTICYPITDIDSMDTHTSTLCGVGHGSVIVIIDTLTDEVCVTYVPNLNYNGNDTICVITCDNGIPTLCDTSYIYITIDPTNEPPVGDNIYVSTSINNPIGVNIVSSTSDPNGDPMTYSYSTSPLNGTWTPTGPGIGIYTPNPEFVGNDSFQYIVCDSSPYLIQVLCDTAWVFITVNDTIVDTVNHAPLANIDRVSTTPGAEIIINPRGNDFDPDGDSLYLSLAVSGTTANGSWVRNSDGTVTFTANIVIAPGIYIDSIPYTICDSGAVYLPSPLCSSSFIIITINSIDTSRNRPPAAVDDYRTTGVNTPLVINVRFNDSDPDGDSLSIPNVIVPPLHGTTFIDPFGNVIYAPNAGYQGHDTFTYVICDNGIPTLCDTARVYITILSLLEANPDTLITGLNTSICYDVRVNDTGSTTLRICGIFIYPSHGTVTVTDTVLCYTPDLGYAGLDTFRYVLCDTLGNTDTATVYVTTILCLPPHAKTNFGGVLQGDSVTIDVVANDLLYGNPLLSFGVTIAPSHGTVLTLGGDSLMYIPDPSYCGTDEFVYSIRTICGYDTALVVIDILCDSCSIPIALADTFDARGYGVGCFDTLDVLANDTFTTSVILTIIRDGIFGHASVTSSNQLLYEPNGTGIGGTDRVIYVITSTCGNDTGIMIVNLPMYPCNINPPQARPDYLTLCMDSCATVNLLSNDFDLDAGQNIRLISVIGGVHGTVVQLDDSTIRYCPNVGYAGVDTVIYTISDDGLPNLIDSFGVIYIQIDSCMNHTPRVIDSNGVLVDTIVYVIYDTSTLDTCLHILDIDGNRVTGSILISPQGDTMYFTGDSCFTYLPSSPGTYTGIIILCDDGVPVKCDTVYIVIHVLSARVILIDAVDDYENIAIDEPSIIDILGNDTIPKGGIDTTITIIVNPVHGTATLNPDGTVTYDPENGFTGRDSFRYILCVTYNSIIYCDTAWVYLFIQDDTLYIPNGFSPNGDGSNDEFDIPGLLNYPNATLYVFNRWGDVVWDTKAPYNLKKWDGNNDAGVPVPDGTYYFILDLKDGSKPFARFVAVHRGN